MLNMEKKGWLIKQDLCLSNLMEINPKWINDLNVKP